MRSTRLSNTASSNSSSSSNVETAHEATRRNDHYYYHHSSRSSQANHSENNGYGNNTGGNNSSSGGGSGGINDGGYRSSSSSSSSKRPSSSQLSSSSSANSTSLIKRLKSVSHSTAGGGGGGGAGINQIHNNNNIIHNARENIRDHPNLKSSTQYKSSSHTSSSFGSSSSAISVDPHECHHASYGGYCTEEAEALQGDSLIDNARQALDQFQSTTSVLRRLVLEILESKKKANQAKNGPDAAAAASGGGSSDGNKKRKAFNNLKIKGLMHLTELRRLNRVDKYRLKEARHRFAASKEKVDKIHLQLQNLQYEVMHLQKEQKTCSSFRSKDESLQLVASDRFYRSDHVPVELRHLIVSRKIDHDQEADRETFATLSESATNDERHKLHLARLDWELKQRIASEEELRLAEESRFRLEVEISAKRRTLTQFDPTLRNVIEASKPLVAQLNVPLQVYHTGNQLTPYLPQALYVLYIQLCAYKAANGMGYDVTIAGTAEEAAEYESKLKKEQEGDFFNAFAAATEDDDDDSHHHHESNHHAKHHRDDQHQLDEDDDDRMERRSSKSAAASGGGNKSQRHQKSSSSNVEHNSALNRCGDDEEEDDDNNHRHHLRHKSISCSGGGGGGGGGGGNGGSTPGTDCFVQKHSKLLQFHPLKVNLMMRFRHYQLLLTFTFYSKIELIGVRYTIENLSNSSATIEPDFCVTSHHSNVFSKLLASGDTGYKSPNSTVEHMLRRFDIDSFVNLLPHVGFAYDWAQRIAGIECLAPDTRPIMAPNIASIRVRSSIAIDSLDRTLKAITDRFQARMNLQEQLLEIVRRRAIDLGKFEMLLESNVMYDDLDPRRLKPKCAIRAFERMSAEAFLDDMQRQPAGRKRKLVEYFDFGDRKPNQSTSTAATRAEESTSDLFDPNNFIFKLTIESEPGEEEADDNRGRHLCAGIIIPHNYPQKWPFFILNLLMIDGDAGSSPSYLESNWLRSLEEHVNIQLPRIVHTQAKQIEHSLFCTTLFLRQIYELQIGLDAIVAAQREMTRKSAQSLDVYCGPRPVHSFAAMSIVEGRDHSLKFG